MKKHKLVYIILISIICNCIFQFSTKQIVINNIAYSSKAYQDFASKYGDMANEVMKETGVYASVILGQAIYESQGGTSYKAQNYNNLYGMKAKGGSTITSSTGETVTCSAATIGKRVQSNSSNSHWSGVAQCGHNSDGYCWWRVYDGMENSMRDYARNLWCYSGGTYITEGAFAAQSYSDQIIAITNAGYSSGSASNYAKDVISIINANDLTKYDTGFVSGTKPSYANTCTDAVYNGKPIEMKDATTNLIEDKIEHFDTSYIGDVTKGWIYNRFDYKEIYNLDAPDYKVEKNINDVIDEIFNRAKSSYYVAYYTGSTIFGVTGGIPNTSSDLKGRYWYEFDINLYLGNTLFGQCVWYAKHRALEIIDTSNYDDETKQKLLASLKLTTGNGQDWFNNPDSSLFKKSANLADARPGSIVSWSRGQYGHVGIIENVYEKNGQTYVTLSDGYRSGGSSATGWTISNTIEDAWAHSVVKSQDMTLDELKNYVGSFNGYVYLTS